jgi:hypothetical protein
LNVTSVLIDIGRFGHPEFIAGGVDERQQYALLLPLKQQASNDRFGRLLVIGHRRYAFLVRRSGLDRCAVPHAMQAEDLPPEVDCSTFDNLALPIWRTMIAKSKCLPA